MKYAVRQLIKNPGFTVVALTTLALGIGVNTAAFTALNRLLLQALPFRDPGRLVQVWSMSPSKDLISHTPGDYLDEFDQNTIFETMAAYNTGIRGSFAEPGQPPVQCGASRVTASFFPLFGIQAQLGRLFTEQEDRQREPVAVISNTFWREHYSADPNVLGRTAKLDNKTYTIVGVLPPFMDDPLLFNGRPAFWLLDGTRVNTGYRDASWYTVAARLKPGVSLKQAQAEMTALALKMAHDFPKTNKSHGVSVIPYPTDSMGELGSQLTWLVMALCGMVLLIACVNLANLQLVRTSRRAQEIALRLALGCSRSTLIRMLVTESLLLSFVGGALGIMIAEWSNAFIARYLESDMPLDLRVIGFAFTVSMLTGLLFGTVPAFIASRTDLNSALKSNSRGSTSDRSRHWLRQGLVVVELTLALTLLAGAGFFVKGIYKVTHQELGWRADNVIVGYIELDHDHFGEQRDPRSVAFGELMQKALEALPGVEAAGLSLDSPAWGFRQSSFRIEGQAVPEPGKEERAGGNNTTPGFFKIYGIKLLQGRDFKESDRLGSPPVVIINETMARKYWPGENPLGKRIGETDPTAPQWAEVVGVMADFKGATEFYDKSINGSKFMRPWAQNSHRFVSFDVRTRGDPRAMKETVRKAIGLLAPNVAVSMLSTVNEVSVSGVSFFSFLRRLLLEISALGLLLSAVGIYGVVANLTSERTKEIGIRLALGAPPAGMVWLFLKNGLQLAAIGATLGLIASFILLHVLTKMIPFVPGNDPWVVVGVAGLLVTVSLAACWLPARRTTRISPTIALRTD